MRSKKGSALIEALVASVFMFFLMKMIFEISRIQCIQNQLDRLVYFGTVLRSEGDPIQGVVDEQFKEGVLKLNGDIRCNFNSGRFHGHPASRFYRTYFGRAECDDESQMGTMRLTSQYVVHESEAL